MDQPDAAALQAIARRWRPDARLLGVAELEGGSTGQTLALDLALAERKRSARLVLRIRSGTSAAATEFALLEHLRAASLPVPEPYFLDESRETIEEPYLAVEFIEGAYELQPRDPVHFGGVLADQLAAIHATPAPSIELPTMASRAERLIALNRPEASEAERDARAALDSATAPIEGSTLLHGDFWPANLIWREGRLVAVIDWEDAALGDPLADLAIARLDLLLTVGEAASEAATDRYLEVAANDAATLPYWDLVAALRAARVLHEWQASWRDLGRHDLASAGPDRFATFVATALERLPQ